MTTINLKDFYYWYIVDELVEVPDEVAEALMASRRDEASYQRRLTRNKAFYSLDCDDGIEYSACLHHRQECYPHILAAGAGQTKPRN